jgi:uridylate kinase
MKRIILKLSGEALAYPDSKGIDFKKVNEIALEIKKLYDLGNIQLGVIVGGGNIWRGKDAEELGIDRSSADYMGMLATILNALAVQAALEKLGLDTRAMTSLEIPAVAEPYIRRKAISHLEKNRIVIFGGGTGLPFFSTDSTAALRGAELGADIILMAKNGVDGVYDKDPNKYQDAKRYDRLTYDEMIEKNLCVMDLTAATLCKENNIKIIIFDMNKKDNIKNVIANPKIGTVIKNGKEKK